MKIMTVIPALILAMLAIWGAYDSDTAQAADCTTAESCEL